MQTIHYDIRWGLDVKAQLFLPEFSYISQLHTEARFHRCTIDIRNAIRYPGLCASGKTGTRYMRNYIQKVQLIFCRQITRTFSTFTAESTVFYSCIISDSRFIENQLPRASFGKNYIHNLFILRLSLNEVTCCYSAVYVHWVFPPTWLSSRSKASSYSSMPRTAHLFG